MSGLIECQKSVCRTWPLPWKANCRLVPWIVAVVVGLAGGLELLEGVVEPFDVGRVVLVVVEPKRLFIIERLQSIIRIRELGQTVLAVLVGAFKGPMNDGSGCALLFEESLVQGQDARKRRRSEREHVPKD